MGDPTDARKQARLRAFAGFVQALNGRYWTAEDVSVSVNDVEALAEHCDYVFGLDAGGNGSGDPSPYTAAGVFQGIRAAVRHRLSKRSLAGIRVAVQGLGSVGYQLCKQLHGAGAELFVSDVDEAAVQRVVTDLRAEAVDPSTVLQLDVDVVAPCALGGVLDEALVNALRAPIIAGAANNQLATVEVGRMFFARGTTVVPDFLINAGGMINASCDIFGNRDERVVRERIEALYDTTLEVLSAASSRGVPPELIARESAQRRLEKDASH